MAIASVLTMVHQRLPFTAPAANDATIESIRVQMCYLMQSQTLKVDADVELESNYVPLQNMLFAAMVAYQMLNREIILTMGGDGTTVTTISRYLKKAKADVTEAEFGSIPLALLEDPADFISKLLLEICSMAQILKYNCPWCTQVADIIPPFIIGEDYPPAYCPPDIFNGEPIGL